MENENTQIVKVKDSKMESAFTKIGEITKSYTDKVLENNFLKPAILCESIAELKSILTDDIVQKIADNLMGNRLGFKTDRDFGNNGKYSVAVIKNCLIESALNGIYWTGNEFNIIASNFYATREGLTNKMNRAGKYSELKIKYGIPKLETEKRAIISFSANWKYNGIHYDLADEIPIKVNNAMTDDAIIGKANRKIRARIIEMCEGISFGDTDADEMMQELKERNKLSNGNSDIPTNDGNFLQLIDTEQVAKIKTKIRSKSMTVKEVKTVLAEFGFDELEQIDIDSFQIIIGAIEDFKRAE